MMGQATTLPRIGWHHLMSNSRILLCVESRTSSSSCRLDGSARYHSSNTTTTSYNKSIKMDWKKETDALLKAESWSNNKWILAREGVRHWSQQMRGFEHTWKLLDCALTHARIHFSRRPEHVQVMLMDLLQDYESTKDTDLIPSGQYFRTLIHLSIQLFYSSQLLEERNSALNRADNLLATMLKYSKVNEGLIPDVGTLEAVVGAWEQSMDPNACHRVMKTLNTIMTCANDNKGLKLNIGMFAPVLQLLSQSQDTTPAATAAVETLRMMQENHVTPNTSCYNCVLRCLSRCEEPTAADVSEELLREMLEENIKPDSYSFNSIMTTYTRIKPMDVLSRAEATMKQMQMLYDAGISDHSDLTTQRNGALHCYNKLIQMYADFREPTKADTLVHTLCSDSMIIPGNNCTQARIAFSTAIFAWSRVPKLPGAAVKAEELFFKMKDLGVSPGPVTYTSLITALASSGNQEKAEFYLEEIMRVYEAGEKSCMPYETTYTSIINGWTRSNNPNAVIYAGKRFEEMKQYCRPSNTGYSALIRCIAKSAFRDKVERACQVLAEMEQDSIRPDGITLNAVLMACAFSNHLDVPARENAFKVARDVFQRSCNETSPSQETFTFFFKAAAGMKGYDRELENAHRLCCQLGFDNMPFVRRAITAAIPHLVATKQKN